MNVIKSKQRELEERSIIGQMTPLVVSGYAGKKIQPELREALPIFLYNIINSYSELDLISTDLIGTDYLTDWTAEIGDAYDSDTIISTVLQSFSDLTTNNKEFFTVAGPKFNCRGKDNKSLSKRTNDFQVKMSFKPGKSQDELLEDFCKLNTKHLQNLTTLADSIFLYTITVEKSYDEDMNPTIGITYRLATEGLNPLIPRDKKIKPTPPPTKILKEGEDPAKKYSEVHIEPELNDPDFMEEFSKRNTDVKIDEKTGTIIFKDIFHMPFYKDYWFGTPANDDSQVNIEELEEPNQNLKDAAMRYKMAQYHGAYEFGKPGQKRGKIPYYKKPSGWHIFWMRILLGINYIKY